MKVRLHVQSGSFVNFNFLQLLDLVENTLNLQPNVSMCIPCFEIARYFRVLTDVKSSDDTKKYFSNSVCNSFQLFL